MSNGWVNLRPFKDRRRTHPIVISGGTGPSRRRRRCDVALALVFSLPVGFGTLQYADVRSSYPPHMTGRAMAVFTMAMFLGVAVMQWFTGAVAGGAAAFGIETYAAVLAAIGASLALGTLAFKVLPAPERRTG